MTLAPDNQPGSPYAWVVNQAGHAAIVGIALGGLFLWLPPMWCFLASVAVYGLVWEWGYQIVTLGSKLYRDAVADTANVGAGAAIAAVVGYDPAFWTIWLGWLVMLAIGAGYRR